MNTKEHEPYNKSPIDKWTNKQIILEMYSIIDNSPEAIVNNRYVYNMNQLLTTLNNRLRNNNEIMNDEAVFRVIFSTNDENLTNMIDEGTFDELFSILNPMSSRALIKEHCSLLPGSFATYENDDSIVQIIRIK